MSHIGSCSSRTRGMQMARNFKSGFAWQLARDTYSMVACMLARASEMGYVAHEVNNHPDK
eukprot:6206861-Pleurochrysis_carterae.AAC.1